MISLALIVLLVALVLGLAVRLAFGLVLLFASLLALMVAQLGGAGPVFTQTLFLLPDRLFDGLLFNQNLLTIPLFVFLGALVQASGWIEVLLSPRKVIGGGHVPPGPVIVGLGGVLGATTGVVGASTASLSLVGDKPLRQAGYPPAHAGALLSAAGALGQVVPPSLVLIILADQVAAYYTAAQFAQGNYAPQVVTSAALFRAAVGPALAIIVLYAAYSWLRFPRASLERAPLERLAASDKDSRHVASGSPSWALVKLVATAACVLGSILAGWATSLEAAAYGIAFVALMIGLERRLTAKLLWSAADQSLDLVAKIYFIMLGAILFSLTMKALSGPQILLTILPPSVLQYPWILVVLVLVLTLVLGCFLDFLETILLVLPSFGALLFATPYDPVWLGVLLALALQTSFLTPPFGLALLYYLGASADPPPFAALARAIWPYVSIQVLVLLVTLTTLLAT